MRKFIISLIGMAAVACMTLQSCTKETVKDAPYVSVDKETIEISKRGVDYSGNVATLEVKSNTYWVLRYDEENVEWLTLSKVAASGDATIEISVTANEGEARTAKLYIETVSSPTLVVNLRQGAADEMLEYYNENCGVFEVEEDTFVPRYDGWNTSGYGAEMVRYTGDAYVSTAYPSEGYEGASGGNNISFTEAGQHVVISELLTQGDCYFNLSFAYRGAVSPEPESRGDLTYPIVVEASNDGENWYPFECNVDRKEGWAVSSTNFKAFDLERFYIRVTGLEAGSAIDDFSINERNEAECKYDLILSEEGDDNRKVGYVYYDEPFDWVTWEFGGTDYIANPSVNTAEKRFDLVYTMSQDLISIFEQYGWTQGSKDEPGYLRLGYIKVGKANSRGIVRTMPMKNIREGKTVNARLDFDAVAYMTASGVKDLPGLRISVTGGATINSATQTAVDLLPVNYEAWPNLPYSVKIYNLTSKSQITFQSSYSSEYLTENAKSDRFFLDNVKVTKIAKSTKIKEEWGEQMPAPVIDPLSIDAAAKTVVVEWEAIDYCGSYTMKAEDAETGENVFEGEFTVTQGMAEGLTPDRTYNIYVRANQGELLCYTTSEWSEPVQATTDSKKLFPSGFVFLYDDFSWLNTEFYPGWATSTTEQRVVDGGTLTLEGHGYSVPTTTKAGDSNRVYARLGMLKYGRGANAGGCNGELFLPESIFDEIPEGMYITIVVNAGLCSYGDPLNEVAVGVTTDDVETVQRYTPLKKSKDPNDSDFDYGMKLVFTVTKGSVIRIFTDLGSGTGTDRQFVDNIKITKE